MLKRSIALLPLLGFSLLPLGAMAAPAPKLTEASQLGTNGLGPVLVGMTMDQAEKAAGRKFSRGESGAGTGSCTYSRPAGMPGVSFMVIDGVIARTDVDKDSQVTTFRGAKVGDSEARIKALYGSQITVEPHQYVRNGHYLVFTPRDKADRAFRVIFETDGKKVTRFRSGRLPEVSYVEGCA
jgi:hypothetical protein